MNTGRFLLQTMIAVILVAVLLLLAASLLDMVSRASERVRTFDISGDGQWYRATMYSGAEPIDAPGFEEWEGAEVQVYIRTGRTWYTYKAQDVTVRTTGILIPDEGGQLEPYPGPERVR